MNYVYCKRESCKKQLLALPVDPNYTSVSIRCVCGARYRAHFRNGEHVLDKVSIDDLSETTLAAIETDPSLKPSDRVCAYASFAKRAKKAMDSYNVAYGRLIYLSEKKHEEWHKRASQEVVKVMSTKSTLNGVELVKNIALAYTGSGQVLEVDKRPWDPARMVDPIYVRRVAEQLGVAQILE